MKTNKGKEKRIVNINLWLVAVAIIASVIGVFFLSKVKINNSKLNLSPENQRAMTYEQYQDGDEAVDGTDNVKFNAFFLRDLNGDGYAEKLKGTCKEIEKEFMKCKYEGSAYRVINYRHRRKGHVCVTNTYQSCSKDIKGVKNAFHSIVKYIL